MSRPAFLYSTAVLVCLLALPAAAQVPPDEAWRSVDTEHFRITFPAHLEQQGRRAGELAERAHRELTAQFREGPSGRIDIVLTDHVDVSNGYARIWPSNRIVLYARPPADHLALAYFDDWLELLVTHELAHIFHLDYGGTLGGIFRTLLGRAQTPLTFPGVVVPGWVVEGLATWYESSLTDAGRVHGTFHEMVLRTAALEGRFENIGQASGNSRQWPGGTRRYAYGSLFFDYLLDKHGRDGMAAFVEAVVRPAAQIPLPRLNAAGRRAFGASLSSEWAAWTEEMRARASRLDGELAALGPISEPEALTRNARYGLHPMASPDGSALIYVRSDGRSYPRLVAMAPDGGEPSTVTRINNRAPFDLLPSGGIVFAQRDYTDRYRVFSDLHVAAIDGAVRRVTEGARLTAPSAGPDGTWAVAVTEGGGTNGLALVDLLDGSMRTLAAPEAGTYWAYPAVSPDGRRIAASRWKGAPARRGRPRCGRARDARGDPRPGPRPGAAVERGRPLPGLVVGPERHPEHPGRGGRSAHRRPRPARHADERADGSGVSERRPRRRVAVLLRLPRRRLGGGAGPVRPGRRAARPPPRRPVSTNTRLPIPHGPTPARARSRAV